MSRLPATIVIFAGFFLIGKLFLLWGILLPDIAADLRPFGDLIVLHLL